MDTDSTRGRSPRGSGAHTVVARPPLAPASGTRRGRLAAPRRRPPLGEARLRAPTGVSRRTLKVPTRPPDTSSGSSTGNRVTSSGTCAPSHWQRRAAPVDAAAAPSGRARRLEDGASGAGDAPPGRAPRAGGAVPALSQHPHPDSCDRRDLGKLLCCSVRRRARRPRRRRTPTTQSDGRCHNLRQRDTPRRPPRTLTQCCRAAPRATWATRPPRRTRRRSRRARGRTGSRRRTTTSRTTRSTATRRQTSPATTRWCARGPAGQTPAHAARAAPPAGEAPPLGHPHAPPTKTRARTPDAAPAPRAPAPALHTRAMAACLSHTHSRTWLPHPQIHPRS